MFNFKNVSFLNYLVKYYLHLLKTFTLKMFSLFLFKFYVVTFSSTLKSSWNTFVIKILEHFIKLGLNSSLQKTTNKSYNFLTNEILISLFT